MVFGKKSLVGVLFVMAVAMTLMTGLAAYRTFTHRGEQAVALMSTDERNVLRKTLLIQRGMSYQEVVAILGEPDRDVMGLRPAWKVNGSPFSQIAVYLGPDGAWQLRWIKLGHFVYERRL